MIIVLLSLLRWFGGQVLGWWLGLGGVLVLVGAASLMTAMIRWALGGCG